jgi:ABC-type polysaccharide/polyol phosphate transport system ATPase subunit
MPSVMRFSTATPAFSPKSSERPQEAAVELRGVSKRFYYYDHRTSTLREWFIRRVLRRPLSIRRAEFTLQGFDLNVARGEAVALLGSNGSGKSTALRLIAGIYRPSSGTIVTWGRLTAVIELGAGFHPELTGADNVALYAAVLGLSRRELIARYDEVVDFAQMREFMDTPLKYYSSGMEARLAFSVAVCLQPDILLLDEVLAVGDQEFRQRCLARLRAYHARGGTLILVSHEVEQVRELCSRAVWLDKGAIRMDGDVNQVLAAYRAHDSLNRSRGAT